MPALIMQLPVNAPCQRRADARGLGQVFDAGPGDLAQAAEVAQQAAAPFFADAVDVLQGRSGARFGPALAVAADGEAVRLVAHALNQAQRRRGFGGRDGPRPAADVQALFTGAALAALGDPQQHHLAEDL